MPWKISGFGDEISDDLATQLRVMRALGVDALEPRRVGLPDAPVRNVVDLSDAELEIMRAMLADHDMVCSQIGSPVGKAPVRCDLPVQVRKLDGAMRAAHALGARLIRVFASSRLSRTRTCPPWKDALSPSRSSAGSASGRPNARRN